MGHDWLELWKSTLKFNFVQQIALKVIRSCLFYSRMTIGFKKGNKFIPTSSKGTTRKKRIESKNDLENGGGVKLHISKKTETIRLKRDKIDAVELDARELRDHPLFEESTEWLDAFASTPEVIVADDQRGIFHIWFGGESHYVHQYSPDGHELDVFSFGFEKNKLSKSEVMKMIQRRLNEKDDEE